MVKESPRPPSTRPPDESASDRLESWKDVAAYLRRDVSTVQRWEKREGMPVHRHVHEKLGTVYAFRSELDAWWRGRGPRLAQQDDLGTEAPDAVQPDARSAGGADRENSRRVRPAGWMLVLLGVVGIGVLVSLAYVTRFGRPAEGAAQDTAALATSPDRLSNDLADAVLRARYLSVRTTDADNRAAITLLERAIGLDPGFAPAYAELAAARVTRLAYVKPEETRDLEQKAFAAAEKALSLDPNLPEAYLARGDLLWSHSQRFAHERAIQEFRRALALNPDSDRAHQRLARVYVHVGFFEEALRHADIALAINPSNAQALNSRAQAALWTGRDEAALTTLLSIPGPVLPELVEANVAFALLRLGRREEAWTYLERAKRKYPDDASGSLPAVEALLLADSEPRKAEGLIETAVGRKAVNPAHHAAYFAACASARMRRALEAVQWLREAAETGFPCYPLFARDPNLDPIRQDSHFQAFMTELEQRSSSLRKAVFPDRD